MLITVCNNKMCKQNQQKPCRAGCLVKGQADYCAACDKNVCPMEEYCTIVPINVVHCKRR